MPPSALTLHILLALAVSEQDIPEINNQIIEDTQSIVIIQEISLYKAIKRLEKEGLIANIEDTRRYGLTPRGRAILKSETMRLGRTSALLRQRT